MVLEAVADVKVDLIAEMVVLVLAEMVVMVVKMDKTQLDMEMAEAVMVIIQIILLAEMVAMEL
tara:strand:+ start:365 stop:553 length:189 start_codon:yes stop_codon:yes gene_type:complete